MATKYDYVNDLISVALTQAVEAQAAERDLRHVEHTPTPDGQRHLLRAQVHMLSAISCQLTKISDQLNDINRASWAEVKIMKQGGDDDTEGD